MWRVIVFLVTGHWPRSRVQTASSKALTELSERVDDLERRLRTTSKKLHTLEGHYYTDLDEDPDELPAPLPAPGATPEPPGEQLAIMPVTPADFPEEEFQQLAARKRWPR